MWLQTSVVDRTGNGSEDPEDAVFVLEFRDQRHINSLLHAQIDVSMIQSIEQLEPAIELLNPAANVSFVIKCAPGADLGGSVPDEDNDQEALWDLCHVGADGVLSLYVVAGPSQWNRREAVNFFDELRIMAHFLVSAPGPAAVVEPLAAADDAAPAGRLASRLAETAGSDNELASSTTVGRFAASTGNLQAQTTQANGKSTSGQPGNAALRALFDSMDQDANGKVTSKEWGKALSKNSEMMAKCFGGSSPQAIGQAFKRIDADGDKELTWEEFVDTAQKFEGSAEPTDALPKPKGRLSVLLGRTF